MAIIQRLLVTSCGRRLFSALEPVSILNLLPKMGIGAFKGSCFGAKGNRKKASCQQHWGAINSVVSIATDARSHSRGKLEVKYSPIQW